MCGADGLRSIFNVALIHRAPTRVVLARDFFSRHRLQVIPIFLKSLSLANDISGELNGGPPLPPGPVMLGTDEEANRAICQRIFEQIDADATGGLDENDLHRALERLHVHLPLKRAARSTGDGDSRCEGTQQSLHAASFVDRAAQARAARARGLLLSSCDRT